MTPFDIFSAVFVVGMVISGVIFAIEVTKDIHELRIQYVNEMANIRKEIVTLRQLAIEHEKRNNAPRPHIVKDP